MTAACYESNLGKIYACFKYSLKPHSMLGQHQPRITGAWLCGNCLWVSCAVPPSLLCVLIFGQRFYESLTALTYTRCQRLQRLLPYLHGSIATSSNSSTA